MQRLLVRRYADLRIPHRGERGIVHGKLGKLRSGTLLFVGYLTDVYAYLELF
jgi:hypothetical protein